MNFFQQQDQARKQSKRLIALFVLALIAIAASIGSLAYLAGGWPLVPWAAGAVLVIMLLASLVKTIGLRQGGGKVARAMGGTLVDPTTQDPLRRRLYNVVEEMAIASGVPVPEVFVLEQEAGLNAFAAGYAPTDAAVAVTRGLLERLDRDELQGVIAHEFSHILNGDMRINIRLMGFVFGIMVIAIMGQHLMHSARFSKNSKDAAPLVILSLAIVLIGYIGLFFGRIIKAAISRQREYLADAAAVQFTRNPEGISGALKKIGINESGSQLQADSEEVGHMLFGQGVSGFLFATHPPLIKRIQAIEPAFTEDDWALFSEQALKKEKRAESLEAKSQTSNEDGVFGTLGGLDGQQMLAAMALLESMPEPLKDWAHADASVSMLLAYLVLGEQMDDGGSLLPLIEAWGGEEALSQLAIMRQTLGDLPLVWRLPLLEMCLPVIKQKPPEERARLQSLLSDLVSHDGQLTVFEYVLDRLIDQSLMEMAEPSRTKLSGAKTLVQLKPSVASVLAVVAMQGHGDAQAQQKAWQSVMGSLMGEAMTWPVIEHWVDTLDQALADLNNLKATEKERLAQAMVDCISSDGEISSDEYALCRAIAARLHIALPLDGGRERLAPKN